jgi:hypothetical protein
MEGEPEHAAILAQPDVVRLLSGLVRHLAYGNKGLWSVVAAVYSGYFCSNCGIVHIHFNQMYS